MSDFGTKKKILLESGTNELEVLEFTIADNHFGINVAKVLEILQSSKVIPMPNANSHVEGVFKPRDIVMTVIDLASYMSLLPSKDPERDIFIVTNFNKISTAFHVHTVEGIHRISWEDIEKPNSAIYGGEDGLATGIARFDGRLITIVDFEKILADISPTTSIQVESISTMGERERSKKPVLISEDSLLLSKMIKESLVTAGYSNLVITSNGREAWEKLLSFKETGLPLESQVACLITDIEMPQMDGHRLLKLIRDDEYLRTLPVIIFSSLINDEMRIKGNYLGATGQISKPEIVHLVSMIDKYIL